MKMDNQEELETYSDYIQMIKHIDPKKLNFKKVTCGYKSVILLDVKLQLIFFQSFCKDKNELWGFGSSLNGQLGTNKMKYNVNRPFNVSRLSDKQFVNVCVSQTHTLAISNTEKLYAWGNTENGCLGQTLKEIHQYSMIKLKKNMFVSSQESYERTMRTVYENVACSDHFSLLKKDNLLLFQYNQLIFQICNDKLYSFGKEDKGRLGCGQKNIKCTDQPLQIQLSPSIKQIKGVACGKNHCLIWDQDGLIYSWGDGSDGKLGHSSVNGGYNYMIVDPQQVKALEEQRIIQASCGYRHSCAITYKGEIFTWGRTVYYKHEKKKDLPLDYLRPKKITSFFKNDDQTISSGAIFVKIASNAYHNAAIDQKGFLYTWGQSIENCLGHENSNDYNQPILVEEFTSVKAVDVACGHHFTVVITTKSNNQLAYKNLKEFKLSLLKNASQNIAKIKEYCDHKMKKRLSESNAPSRATSASTQNTPKYLNFKRDEIIENDKQNKKYFPSPKLQQQKISQPPMMIRATSQPPVFQYQNKNIERIPQINPHLKQKYHELIISETMFKQNVKNGIIKLEMEQKRILNQKQLSSTKSSSSYHGQFVRQKSQSSYVNANRTSLNHQESDEKNQKQNDFFEYSNNKIIFDTIHNELDSKYEEFSQIKNEEKTPRSSMNKSIEPTVQIKSQQIGIQKRDNENSTRKERLDEIQQKAELRRLKSNNQKKGIVLDENIFNQEIDQIYKEYKEADLLEKDQRTVSKYMREKENEFLRQRQQVNLETRFIFQDARNEFYSTQNSEAFRSPINSSQTLNKIQQQFPKSNFNSISSLHTPQQKSVQQIDFIKNEKWKTNDDFLLEKMQSSQQKFFSKDEKILSVLERKGQLEQQKKDIRDQKRKEYLLKSREYQDYLEKIQTANHNQNSVRMNWFVYMNVEQICQGFKKLAQLGLQKARAQFFFVTRVKKIQRLFRRTLLCQNGNITRVQDAKNQEVYKENLDRLSSSYGFKRSYTGDFTVVQSKYEDYTVYMEKHENLRKSMNFSMSSLPEFYGFEQKSQNIEELINLQATREQTKFGLVLSALNVGAKSHGQQLNEFIKQSNIQGQNEIHEKKHVRINDSLQSSPAKSAKKEIRIESILNSTKKEFFPSQQDELQTQEEDEDDKKSKTSNKSKGQKNVQSQIDPTKLRSFTFDFSKSVLPYSLHANDIITPNIYTVRLEIIKANEQAMKVATEAEQTIKKKVMLMVLRSLRQKHKQNIEQFNKIQQKFMSDNANQINMERARLMLITPPQILHQIWQKDLDSDKLGKVKSRRFDKKKDHLPFYDLRVKIASTIPNAPIKPSFKLQITFDQFKLFFNKYYDMVRKQYTYLEAKGLIRSQVRKKK